MTAGQGPTDQAAARAVPDELVKRAVDVYDKYASVSAWRSGMAAALAVVADDQKAAGRRECAAELQPVIATLYEIECYGPAGRLEALAEKWKQR